MENPSIANNTYNAELNDFYTKALRINLELNENLKKETESKIDFASKRLSEENNLEIIDLLQTNKSRYLEELAEYDDNIESLEQQLNHVLYSLECANLVSDEERSEIYNAGYSRISCTLDTLKFGVNIGNREYLTNLKVLDENNKNSVLEVLRKIEMYKNMSKIPKGKMTRVYKQLIYLKGEQEYLANEVKQYKNNQLESTFSRRG